MSSAITYFLYLFFQFHEFNSSLPSAGAGNSGALTAGIVLPPIPLLEPYLSMVLTMIFLICSQFS
jgi:hypothetical protein